MLKFGKTADAPEGPVTYSTAGAVFTLSDDEVYETDDLGVAKDLASVRYLQPLGGEVVQVEEDPDTDEPNDPDTEPEEVF